MAIGSFGWMQLVHINQQSLRAGTRNEPTPVFASSIQEKHDQSEIARWHFHRQHGHSMELSADWPDLRTAFRKIPMGGISCIQHIEINRLLRNLGATLFCYTSNFVAMADNLPRMPPRPTVEDEDPHAQQEDEDEPPPLGPPLDPRRPTVEDGDPQARPEDEDELPPLGPPLDPQPPLARPQQALDAEGADGRQWQVPQDFPGIRWLNPPIVFHLGRAGLPGHLDAAGHMANIPGGAAEAVLMPQIVAPLDAANDQDSDLPDRDTFFGDYLSVGTRHYLNLATYTLGEPPTDCFICKNVFGVIENEGETPELAILLPCGHAAGHMCLKRWFCDIPAGSVRPRNCCPYCSTKFFRDDPNQAAMLDQDEFMGVWQQEIPLPALPPHPNDHQPHLPFIPAAALHQIMGALLPGDPAQNGIEFLRREIQWEEQQRAGWVHQLAIEQDDAMREDLRQRILESEGAIRVFRERLDLAEQAHPPGPPPRGPLNFAQRIIIPVPGEEPDIIPQLHPAAVVQPPAQLDDPPAQAAEPEDPQEPPELVDDFPDDNMPDLGPVLPAAVEHPMPVIHRAAFLRVLQPNQPARAFEQVPQPADEDHDLEHVVERTLMDGLNRGVRGANLRNDGSEIVRRYFQALAPAIPPPDAREIAEVVEAVANRLELEAPAAHLPLENLGPALEPPFAELHAGDPHALDRAMATFRDAAVAAAVAAGIQAQDVAHMRIGEFYDWISLDPPFVVALRNLVALVIDQQPAQAPAPEAAPGPDDAEPPVEQDEPGFLVRVLREFM
ncbi:hypothetical protein BU16DRAFT_583730 [Lophium mytilinum]|uniref:RING-type domain-containing protein n=1 Tax=Lophium mytilinum TaxID=390894 RepID=A0A6A6QJX4_9PEZI|nr:hypothetical protein BU16DRAFT_583730 [Lophium mytilinum]